MSQDRVPAPANPLAGIASILETLGGQRATSRTNPGDISGLQQVMAGLQGQDFEALLQSIFQQASGQIPGLQAAYGNAVGARSGNNSAVQAALNELLKQTTLAGQQQIASQQAQNFQTQAQAASGIAQATKGTKTTETRGTNLGRAAQGVAGLQLLGMLMGSKDKPGLFSQAKDALGGFTSPQSATPVTAPTPLQQTGGGGMMSSAPVQSPMMSFPSGGVDIFNSMQQSPTMTGALGGGNSGGMSMDPSIWGASQAWNNVMPPAQANPFINDNMSMAPGSFSFRDLF